MPNFDNTEYTDSASISVLHASGSLSGTASYAATCSYASVSSSSISTPNVKRGVISGSLFTGSPKSYTIIFPSPYPSLTYGISVIGEGSYTWTVSNVTSGSFTISVNSNQGLNGLVYWMTISP